MHFDRLKRREFITLLGGAAVAGPRRLMAQPVPRRYRIGALVPFPLAALAVFVDTLRQLGFVDGQNLTIDGRSNARRARRNMLEKLRIMRAKSCCAHMARYRVGELYFPHFADV
jgi:hypothetical protein